MFINEIFDKKLKKPLEVKVSKTYIAENEDLELYGEGDTESEAIEDFKVAVMDIYESSIIYDKYHLGKAYKNKFMEYFD